MIGSLIGAGASIAGSLIQGDAATSAAQTQAQAAQAAAQEQLQAAQLAANTSLSIYGSTKASLSPYTNTGTAALNQLAMLYGLPVYTTPSAASQTPVVPGLNGPSSAAALGGSGPFGSLAGGTGAASNLTGRGTAGGQGATTAQQIAELAALGGPGAIQKYLAANASLTPDQQLAGLKQLIASEPRISAAFNQWLNTPMTTPGTDTGVPTPAVAGTGIPNTAAMFTALENFPGYQFGLQQGQAALDRSAASQGLLLSGAQLQAAQEFGTNYGLQQGWAPYISQLNALSGLGENAAAGAGNAGTAAAGQVGGYLTQGAASAGSAQLAGAQATAAGQIAQGNALNSALQNSLLAFNASNFGGGSSNWYPGAGGYGPGAVSNLGSADALSNVLTYGY